MEAPLKYAVNSLADAFFPLASDLRIAPGVAPLLHKPVTELLVNERLPLTIEFTLRLLRNGLQIVNFQGKIFVPTYYGTGQTRDWSNNYVSFSGNVSARTVYGKASWYLLTTIAVGAIAGKIALTTASPTVALTATPWVTVSVFISKSSKAKKVAIAAATRITKWFHQETLSPYSFKWDPSEPLMAVEGHV